MRHDAAKCCVALICAAICSSGSATFRVLLLFSALRRFAYLVQRGRLRGRRATLICRWTWTWSWKVHSNKAAYNSSFMRIKYFKTCMYSACSIVKSVSSFWSSAQLLHGYSAADVSPAYAATLPRPVYESFFRTSKEVYETSHNLQSSVSFMTAASARSVASVVTLKRRAVNASIRSMNSSKVGDNANYYSPAHIDSVLCWRLTSTLHNYDRCLRHSCDENAKTHL